METLRRDHFLGVRFAINVFIGSILAWLILRNFTNANPIWATASMVASSEPVVKQAAKMFRSRLINTLVGCAVGLLFLSIGEPNPWKLPFALATAVLVATYIVRIPTMWRQAPITAAIVIAGSLSAHSERGGMEVGLKRVAEVILGCVVGLATSWVMSLLVPIREPESPPKS